MYHLWLHDKREQSIRELCEKMCRGNWPIQIKYTYKKLNGYAKNECFYLRIHNKEKQRISFLCLLFFLILLLHFPF